MQNVRQRGFHGSGKQFTKFRSPKKLTGASSSGHQYRKSTSRHQILLAQRVGSFKLLALGERRAAAACQLFEILISSLFAGSKPMKRICTLSLIGLATVLMATPTEAFGWGWGVGRWGGYGYYGGGYHGSSHWGGGYYGARYGGYYGMGHRYGYGGYHGGYRVVRRRIIRRYVTKRITCQACSTVRPPAVPACATLSVKVPHNAVVYINDKPTKASGSQRLFRSVPIESGQAARFEVRATLDNGGRTSEATQVVTVGAGRKKEVTLAFGGAAVARR